MFVPFALVSKLSPTKLLKNNRIDNKNVVNGIGQPENNQDSEQQRKLLEVNIGKRCQIRLPVSISLQPIFNLLFSLFI